MTQLSEQLRCASKAAGEPLPPAGHDPLSQYYTWVRNDILARVPGDAKRVLSVGCGAGVTEAHLVRRGIEVIGIEMSPPAAAAAAENGLTVLNADVRDVDDQLAGSSFDCLIYADVLEHLSDPEAVLRRHVERLAPGGVVIVTVPNFRNYRVFWELFIKGLVRYTDAGIFDRTHLRLTTRRMVESWFRHCGIELCKTQYGISRRRDRWLARSLFGAADEFIASQVLLTGTKAPAAPSDPAPENGCRE